MSDEQYKNYISSIINRLINERLVYPEINNCSNSNKKKIKIIIKAPEWYMDLDDDTKYNVEYNIHQFYRPIIDETLQELISNDTNGDTSEIACHRSKRLKID